MSGEDLILLAVRSVLALTARFVVDTRAGKLGETLGTSKERIVALES